MLGFPMVGNARTSPRHACCCGVVCTAVHRVTSARWSVDALHASLAVVQWPASARSYSTFTAAHRKAASGLSARVCGVVGSQWGDEGKEKLVDILAKKCVSLGGLLKSRFCPFCRGLHGRAWPYRGEGKLAELVAVLATALGPLAAD